MLPNWVKDEKENQILDLSSKMHWRHGWVISVGGVCRSGSISKVSGSGSFVPPTEFSKTGWSGLGRGRCVTGNRVLRFGWSVECRAFIIRLGEDGGSHAFHHVSGLGGDSDSRSSTVAQTPLLK